MQQTLCPWWNYPTLQNKLDSIVVGVYYWTTVEWKELLPDPSLSHLDYGSKSYDLGLYGTSTNGICYSIAIELSTDD